MTRLMMLAGLVLASGCYTHNISLDGSTKPSGSPDNNRWHHHLIGGLVNLSPDYRVNEICPNGAAYVRTEIAWYQFLISGVTSGIYTPGMDRVWCKSGNAMNDALQENATDTDVVVATELVIQDTQSAALDTL